MERLIAGLERLARRLRGDPPLAELGEALGLLRIYAELAHHGKEEGHLFPALIRAGVAPDDGPVGTMLREHDVGRCELETMASALEALARGDEAAATLFAGVAAEYSALLRDHIDREDLLLFPLADDLLAARTDELAQGYDRVDAAVFGQAGRATWEARIDALDRAGR